MRFTDPNINKLVSEALDRGAAIYVENPDGTRIRLQPGAKINCIEAITLDNCEQIDFNRKYRNEPTVEERIDYYKESLKGWKHD